MFQLKPKKIYKKAQKREKSKKKLEQNITELTFKWNVGESETVILKILK